MDFTEITAHIEVALDHAQDRGLPVEILDKMDDILALIDEYELDLEELENE